ncbi:MAG: hypothetical protein COA90_11540 [Gammaproteobacteria bacterium]|nr:MAG: hypothetical protein COA90_11540 [Gammaproteobacteria bacterium]
MIQNQRKYEIYIKECGVGKNDVVADSCKSYVSYLNSVSKHLNITISPEILSQDKDVITLSDDLTKSGKVSKKTIKNYSAAMKQYVNMVVFLELMTS